MIRGPEYMETADSTPVPLPNAVAELNRVNGRNGTNGSTPPGNGQYPIPHALTFAGLINQATQTYGVSDEALRHAAERAPMMLNDPVVTEPLEARQRATALLDWHLETNDKDNAQNKKLCEELSTLIKAIPDFGEYKRNLLLAQWYGRYAIFQTWNRMKVDGKQYNGITEWKPVSGDKLVFRYAWGQDHGAGKDIGVRVSPLLAKKDVNGKDTYEGRELFDLNQSAGGQTLYTSQGMAYFLAKEERCQIAIHKHMIEDGTFEDVLSAGRIHGVGIRDRIYWAWFQKQQALATIMALIQRFGTGFTIARYPMGNEPARLAMIKAIQETRADNALIVPQETGNEMGYDIQRIEPTDAGLSALDKMVHEFFGHMIKRYIVGQTLTSEAAGTGLGSNLADVQLGTFGQIIQYDALKLAETLTHELVYWLKLFNFPQYADVDVRFVLEIEGDKTKERLEALKIAHDMGLPIAMKEVYEMLSLRSPEPDEDVLEKPEPMPGDGFGGDAGNGPPKDKAA